MENNNGSSCYEISVVVVDLFFHLKYSTELHTYTRVASVFSIASLSATRIFYNTLLHI